MLDFKLGRFISNVLEDQSCTTAFSRYDPFTKILYYEVGWISTSFTNVLDVLVSRDIESAAKCKIIKYLCSSY